MWCLKLNKHGVCWRFDCYLLCCALVAQVFVKQILVVDHNLEYLEFEDPLYWPLLMAPIVKICKTNKLITKAQHNKYQPRRKKTPCLLMHMMSTCIHNQGWKYFAVGKDQVAIQPVTVIHNFLLIHIVKEKFCHQVLVLLWTKITWAVTRKWHNSNQFLP